MAIRFRKRIKILPGVNLNINKKSVGLTAGVRGAHVSINSKGQKTTSVGIPNTGLSYVKTKNVTNSKQAKTQKPKGLFGLFKKKEDPAVIAEMIEWQNAVMKEKSDKLYTNRQQLENITIQTVENDVRIFDDCANIINSTIKPDVFFPRLQLAEEKLAHLSILEPYIHNVKVITLYEPVSTLMDKFQNEKQKYIYDFIHRYYWDIKDKAEAMKTEKGKDNKYQKFYDSLIPFFNVISDQNKGYIEAMYKREI